MSTLKDYAPRVGPDYLATNFGRNRTAVSKYKFSQDGGAIGLITPLQNEIIPDNAVIKSVTINSTVAVTSLGSATISVGLSAGGGGAAALLAATAKASFSLDAIQIGVPVAATPLKMTAAGLVTLTVAVAALTAGEIEVVVSYHQASA